jgi:serine phosphatase RsbU (regulator of sigma subunit)
MTDSDSAEGERVLGEVLDASHNAPPDDVPHLLDAAATRLGARGALLYLADVDQRWLVPVSGRAEWSAAAPERPDPPEPPEPPGSLEAQEIDGTLAGRAFQTGQPTGTVGDGPLWFPVRDGAERLGVLRLGFTAPDDAITATARRLASLAAGLVVAKGQYGDLFELVRRRRPLGLAAELQWQLLPPLTFNTDRVGVAGILEPAYEVAGDSFDYALNGDVLSAAVFDGVGHNLSSAVMTTVAVGAYRQARREERDLTDTAAIIDDGLQAQFHDSSFVTAALIRLDVATGTLRWLNAGHPRPLLLRGGRVVRTLACPPRPPLGIRGPAPLIGTEQLEPGDSVLLFTDGVVEARSAQGKAFGFDRLAEFLQRAAASRLEPAETMRRLVHDMVGYHGGRLQDDATCVLVEWHPRSP